MKIETKIILLSACSGLAACLLDGLVDYAFFYEGRKLWAVLFTEVSVLEIYMRTALVLIFLFFGVVVSRMVANRNKALDALYETEQRFEAVFENAIVGVYRTTPDGRILLANPALIGLLGYNSFEEFSDRNLEKGDFHPRYSRNEFKEQIEREGEVKGLEEVWKKRDGSTLHIRENARIVRDSSGNTLYYEGTVEDITVRRDTEEALRASEDKYRELVEGTKDLITKVDGTGRLVYVNHVAESVFGASKEKCVGRSAFDFIHPDDRERTEKWYMECVAKQVEQASIENRQINQTTGDAVHMLWTCNFRYDDTGQVEGVNGIARDITDRKQAEEDLRQESHMREVLLDNMPHIALILKKGTREIVASNKVAREVGAVPGTTCYETCALRDDNCPFCLAPEVWETGESRRTEVEYEGTYYEGIWVPLTEDLYVHYIQDITDRKKAEEGLRISNELLSKTEEIAKVGSWRLDLRTNVLTWSDEVYRIFGLEPGTDNLSYETFLQAVHPDDREMVDKTYTGAIENNEPYEVIHRILRPDGEVRVVHERSEDFLDESGKTIMSVGMAHDITEQKRAEKERRHLEIQMQQTQKLESLGVMAGGIAHDFNNILYAVLGNAELALDTMPPEAIGRDHLQEIQTAAKRAAGLTNQMLAYSGKGALALEKLDLSELVQEMAHLLEVSHSKKAIINYRFDKDLPAVEVDPSQLRQVVMNLITNASEAVGDNEGLITIKTGLDEVTQEYLSSTYVDDELPSGSYAYLEVTDTGCGMDEATKRRIFEPFFTTKFTGRGLGMAAVLGIVRAHRGAIDIESTPGRGTAVKVLLPALDDRAKTAEEVEHDKNAWLGHGTVLVVDDERQVRRLQEITLTRKGFSVLTAEDGRQAVEVFREHKDEIVCVVLDLTMPHMDGEQAFVEMRNIQEDVRAILISGYSEKEVKDRSGDIGFSGFLKKPCPPQLLLEKVYAVLNGTQNA